MHPKGAAKLTKSKSAFICVSVDIMLKYFWKVFKGCHLHGMDLKFIMTHISIILSNGQALYNNRTATIKFFIFVFFRLTVMNQPYLDSGEKSQSYVLTIQINSNKFISFDILNCTVFKWILLVCANLIM